MVDSSICDRASPGQCPPVQPGQDLQLSGARIRFYLISVTQAAAGSEGDYRDNEWLWIMHAYYLLTAYANVWILDTPLPSYYHVSHLDTDNGDGDRSPAPACCCVSCKYSDCGAQLCCQLYQSACWRICTRSLMPVSRSRPLVRNHRKLLSLAASEVARRSHIKHFRRRISRLQPSTGQAAPCCSARINSTFHSLEVNHIVSVFHYHLQYLHSCAHPIYCEAQARVSQG